MDETGPDRALLGVHIAVGVLKAVAEPTRLRLLALLARGELNVKDLTRILNQSQPRISRHLKLLAEAGLIERAPERFEVVALTAHRDVTGLAAAARRTSAQCAVIGDAALLDELRAALDGSGIEPLAGEEAKSARPAPASVTFEVEANQKARSGWPDSRARSSTEARGVRRAVR